MKYGEALKLVFEAFYSDRSDPQKQFIHTDLKAAIEQVPLKWRSSIWLDVNDISRELKASALRCKHEKLELDNPGLQRCGLCTATRMKIVVSECTGPFGSDLTEWQEWRL